MSNLVVIQMNNIKWYLIVFLSAWCSQINSQILQEKNFISDFDQSKQNFIEILPQAFDEHQSHHLIIALHGHGSDRWQYATWDRDECNAFRNFALQNEMIAVTPDYRGKTSWMNYAAERDIIQIIHSYKTNFRIEKVFIVGGSMGGTGALTFAALHPDLVDGVTAMNPLANHLEYNRFQDAIARSFGGWKEQIPEEYKKRSAEYWPECFIMPVAITVGLKDTIVPPKSILRFANVLKAIDKDVYLNVDSLGGHETNYEQAMNALMYMYNKK